MQFAPKTEKQLVEENLIPAGTYPFEVAQAESKRSKGGNEMIELNVRIFLDDGRSRFIRDYLLEKLAFKLFHFCTYTGLAKEYEAGTLQAQDCNGRTGFAKIGIKKDKTGEYPDQNAILDYVRPEMKSSGVTERPQPTAEQLANQVNKDDSKVEEDVPW
jgi:hypothetical protein